MFWPIALILLAALLEAGYYFRWIKVFYAPGTAAPAGRPEAGQAYAPLLLIAVLLLLLGVAPFLMEDWFVQAARALLGRETTLESVLGVQP